MNLSVDEAEAGATAAFQNGIQMLGDAEILRDAGGSHGGLFLTILGIEELGKSEILQSYVYAKKTGLGPVVYDNDVAFGDWLLVRESYDEKTHRKLKARRERVKNLRDARNEGTIRDPLRASRSDHNLKFQQIINWLHLSATASGYFSDEYLEEKGLLRLKEYSQMMGVDLELMREDCLYVDYDEDRLFWRTPQDIPLAPPGSLLELARYYRVWVRAGLRKGYQYWEVNADITRLENLDYESALDP